ncbi:MAG: efflux RND transporter periplasmic adaptor subunit [Anaerolineae bacterium]|nr:efflux RND transporter periplasmic adaptor subunit [Anaerolineae bacterium]
MKGMTIVVTILALAAAGYGGLACTSGPSRATPQPVTVMESGPEMIWASGTLRPARWAVLSFETGGRLGELRVEEGQEVAAGELLAVVEAPDLEHAVAQAQAALALAQARLDQVQAGARPEEIAAAEAQVQAAEAALAGAQAAVATAEANVEAARAAVPGVDAAQAALAAAQAELARLRAGPRPEAIAVAEAQVQQAATALAFAQSQLDRFGEGAAKELLYQRDAAAAAHNTALAQLELAKAPATKEDIAVAQAAVAAAQAQLTEAEKAVKAAQAQVSVAEAGVKAALAQVASAEAGVAQAQARLALLRAGATPEEVAIAQAQVDQAQAALAQAQGALDKVRLHAPFAGTVGQVLVRVGELVSPGQPVIILGDLGHLRVETTDLRETDVAKVTVGQAVEVTFDALPGEVWQGTVTRIAPMSREEQGSTNYTAIVELEQVDPRLRWGMTAFVNIATGR